ncbi:MepB family protein [Olivibacter domesticus]|uniref:MepB protein n=1 Tax=Olivibacter domesticus TaxID=407022 RepID=A0A1H7QYA3_OLID1|nr:MepB family protein [Olivibacter domesticus]SEL52892.1 hypothetical protein SAMN05661044_02769 [Olivibacter domesticus]
MATSSLNNIHKDLLTAITLVYKRCGAECTSPIADAESADYAAFTFKINKLTVKYRAAKITPTKIGQFVTLWKREKGCPIQPFHLSDDIDIFIVSTRYENRLGQFIFPKTALLKHGILSDENKDGKRAIRVYPPWDCATNKQAQKSQQWQLSYFLEIQPVPTIDLQQAKKLLFL